MTNNRLTSLDRQLLRMEDSGGGVAMLSDGDKEILREDRFMIKPPARWRDSLKITSELCPIFRGTEQSPDLSVAFYSDIFEVPA